MSGEANLGTLSYLTISKSDTHVASTDGVDLQSENLVTERPLLEVPNLNGSRERNTALENVIARITPSGTFSFLPRSVQLNLLAELLLGGGSSVAGWYPTSSATLTPVYVNVCKANAKVTTNLYAEQILGVINELTLSSQQNGALQAEVGLVGKTSTRVAGVTPTYANISGKSPFLHSQLVVSGDLGALAPYSMKLSMKNNVNEEGYANSMTRQFIENGQFEADLELEVNFNDTTLQLIKDKYEESAITGIKPVVVVTMVYTNVGESNKTLTIVFCGTLDSPPPTMSGREAQRTTLKIKGGKDATHNTVKITVA